MAFADHGAVDGVLGPDHWTHADQVIAGFEAAGVDVRSLAERLQAEGADAFVKAWKNMLQGITEKIGQLQST